MDPVKLLTVTHLQFCLASINSLSYTAETSPGSKIYYAGDRTRNTSEGQFWSYDYEVTPTPVNQVPYLYYAEHGGWMTEVAEIAHEIADHKWEAYQMAQSLSWQHGPLTPHTTESHHRNRVALLYARAVCGYAFNRLSWWESLGASLTNTLWVGIKDEMEELIQKVCGTCDGRNFSNQLVINMSDPAEWERELDRRASTDHPAEQQCARGDGNRLSAVADH